MLLLIITGVTVQAGGLSEENINNGHNTELNLLLDLKLQLTKIEQLINIDNTNIIDNSSIQNEINDIKLQITKVENSNSLLNSSDWNYELYIKRLENLEWKYIDIVATEKTLNWWMTFLLVVFTLWVWWTWWQKSRMVAYAEDEMAKLNKIVSKKEEELKIFKKDFDKKLENIKFHANQDFILIESKYEELNKKYHLAKQNHNTILEKQNDVLLQIKNINNIENIKVEKDAEKYIKRWDEYYKIWKNEAAIIQYDKALEIDKDYVEALLWKIIVWASDGNIDIAEKSLDEWIDDSQISSFTLLLGYSLIKKYWKAEKQISKMLKNGFFEIEEQRNIFYNSKMLQNIAIENSNLNFIKQVKDKYWDK